MTLIRFARDMHRCLYAAVGATCLAVLAGCGHDGTMNSRTAEAGAGMTLSSILESSKGGVLLLLLGRDGCSGTVAATSFLDEYMANKPENVTILRLDVPLPGESLQTKSGWSHEFPRLLDVTRRVADELHFFYYPTLYIFDGDGVKRFAGGCDGVHVARMVREISEEKPGQEKTIYTRPLPAIGGRSPDFSGKTLSGETATRDHLLGSNGMLVCFLNTSCSFTVKELPNVKRVADAFGGKRVSTVIINQAGEPDEVVSLYEAGCPGLPVVDDAGGDICRAYGVEVSPFFFLLDADATVIERKPFTHTAAVHALNAMLGIDMELPPCKSTEGG